MKRIKGKQGAENSPVNILVTGASSGIGAALAFRYAAKGVSLSLWGRNEGRLARVAEACVRKGAQVHVRALDLSDGTEALAAMREDDDRQGLDLVILAAGMGDIRKAGDLTEHADTVLKVGLVNYAVPSALATLAAERMVARGSGQIALIGSVAAFHDLPFGTAYCGSKSGLGRFASALGLALRDKGVSVTLVSPGFVDTPMSQRLKGARPFLVSAARAATLIASAISRGEGHLVFPWPFKILRIVDMLMPKALRDRIMLAVKADQTTDA